MADRRRRLLQIAGGTLAAIGLFAGLFYFVARAPCFQLIGTPVCRVETQEKLVGLSFDDGPTREGVDALLPVLARYEAHASFFLVGNALAELPGEGRRLIAAGHELGNHSYTHQRMWGLFPGGYEDEIRRTDALLRAEGARPTLFRPPYGKKLTGLPIAVARTGYRTVTWDVEDPMTATNPRVYADEILAQIRPGSIVVIHAMYRSGQVARDALPLILEGLKRRGYRAVTVSELLRHAA